MSLMSALYTGQSGIQGNQNALNTTAHNLSNLDTPGFTRQQSLMGDRFYQSVGYAAISDKWVGYGVNYEQVRTVRDIFLDKSYRLEAGRTAFYDVNSDVSNEIFTLLGEFQGVAFNDSLTNLKYAIAEVKKTPTDATALGVLVSRASQFVERAQAVYSGLVDYQNNLNAQVKGEIDKINAYGEKIYVLNEKIVSAELAGEKANDLRDERDLILDELGALASISYSEDNIGNVSVSIEGVNFVNRDFVNEMGVTKDPVTGFYTPVWPMFDDEHVFNRDQIINSALDTDVGKLKALVIARGDHHANYTDLQNAVNYNQYIAPSAVMNTQAELDSLVHSMVTTINDLICGSKGQPEDINNVSYATADELPRELFSRIGTDRYELNATTGRYEYVQEGAATSSMYSIMNLMIHPDIVKQPTLLNFRTDDKSVDQKKADALMDAWETKNLYLNPNTTKPNNFQDFYSDFVSEKANAGSVYQKIVKIQQTTMNSIDSSRQQVSGVSSDEELTNMIKFQNAFNASSRYYNAVNEMLDHLLNRLG